MSYPTVTYPAFPNDLAPGSSNPLSYSEAPVALPAAANTTATVAQAVGGTFDNTAATGVNTLTLPDADDIVAGLPGALVGTSFTFHVIADAGSALTVAAGTGGTLVGSNSVAAGSGGAQYRVRLTNLTSGAEAYELLRLA
jgi:hypothetical protein